MKKSLLIFLFCSIVLSGHASVILWNSAFAWGSSVSGRTGTLSLWGNTEATGETYRFYPVLTVLATVTGRSVELSPSIEESVVAAYGDNWVQLEEGDVVDASTTRFLNSYFLHGEMDATVDGPPRSDYSISVTNEREQSVFLGLATYVIGPDSATGTAIEYPCYGWVELLVTGRQMRLGRTALDLSGGPLVVGQIPEPTSGALALLGAVLLLFRRRNQ